MMNAAAPSAPPPQLPPLNFAPSPTDPITQLLMGVAVVVGWFALNLAWGILDDMRHRGSLEESETNRRRASTLKDGKVE